MDIEVIPAPGVHVVISNPFPDQVQMIQMFLDELKQQLAAGQVYAAALEEVIDFITHDFLQMIIDMAAQCLEDAISIFGTKLDLDLPEIPVIGPIDIPQVPSAKEIADQAKCAAMGAMSEAAAQALFIQDLVEAVKSAVGQICIKDMLEKIIKEDIVEDIKQIAEDAINMVQIEGLEIGELVLPPIIPFEIPSLPDPLRDFNPHDYIPRINVCLEITAEIDVDLSGFESLLFAPELLKCIPEMIKIVKDAIQEAHDILVNAAAELFTEIIEAAAPPPPPPIPEIIIEI